jgi:outer membrane protein assembly factor BamA
LFQGIGNRDADEPVEGPTLDPRAAAVATRFGQERLLAMLRAGYSFGRPGESLQVGATALYNVRQFGAKQKGDEPSIEQVYDTSTIVGFDRRVATLEADLNLVVDTRDVKGATSSGLYLDAFVGRVPQFGSYGFWHHGAELTAYIDLYRRTRVLVLRGVVEGVEGDDQNVPFSELPRLGGASRLRGYPLDRFRDEKAVVGTLEYHYPIHQYVAGSLYLDVGKVAQRYGDFLNSDWKVGGGGGFIVRSRDKQLFTFDIAYGEGVQFHLTTDPLRAFSKRDTEL